MIQRFRTKTVEIEVVRFTGDARPHPRMERSHVKMKRLDGSMKKYEYGFVDLTVV